MVLIHNSIKKYIDWELLFSCASVDLSTISYNKINIMPYLYSTLNHLCLWHQTFCHGSYSCDHNETQTPKNQLLLVPLTVLPPVLCSPITSRPSNLYLLHQFTLYKMGNKKLSRVAMRIKWNYGYESTFKYSLKLYTKLFVNSRASFLAKNSLQRSP